MCVCVCVCDMCVCVCVCFVRYSTPSGHPKTMKGLRAWGLANGMAFEKSRFIEGENNTAAFVTKDFAKDDVICGIFGERRNRRPRLCKGRVVGLKLADGAGGKPVYMKICNTCPGLFVNDPQFDNSSEASKRQVVNCMIVEDPLQPDGSAFAVCLRALCDIKATADNPVELWLDYNLTERGANQSRKIPLSCKLDPVFEKARV